MGMSLITSFSAFKKKNSNPVREYISGPPESVELLQMYLSLKRITGIGKRARHLAIRARVKRALSSSPSTFRVGDLC